MFEKVFLHFLLGSLLSLITITNPLSKIPLFIAIADDMDEHEKNLLALRACMYAFFIMLVSLFAGGFILEIFGISYGALRVAGGITVAILGYRMLFQTQDPSFSPQVERRNSAFFPLALPSISGPGVIAVVIGISTEIAELRWLSSKALAYSATVISIFVSCLVVWLTLRSARYALRVIGRDGMEAMTRMMGFLLICIGVQFVGSGIRTFVGGF